MAEEQKKAQENKPKVDAQDVIVETKHQATINGQEIHYTVTAGTIVLKEETETDEKSEGEKAKATLFFVAYTRDDVDDQQARPLTFSFNGGPGSSSVWLHMGVLGPRRVLLDDMGNPLPPPFTLVNNEYSLLDKSDLVFIDPVGTGYSRMVTGEKVTEYLTYQKDIEAVGAFIHLYTTRYQRWASPKFLIGESYGTTRAAGLAGHLQQRYGLFLNGVMLVSVVLNFQTLDFNPGNDLPYILFLPSYTATAWYHNRLNDNLQKNLKKALAEVEAFALREYTVALMQGDALPAAEQGKIIRKLARYTGLSSDYIKHTNLRIEIMRFTKELLREQRRTIGRLDSRFQGLDRDAAGENFEFDPSMYNITGTYTAVFNHYIRTDLGFQSDLPYEILNNRTHQRWRYDTHENRYLNVADILRQAISMNPYLKVFVASGYYDLATPYLATDYTFNHLSLDSSLRANITMHYYEAGHMMYTHLPSLIQLKQDLDTFINNAT